VDHQYENINRREQEHDNEENQGGGEFPEHYGAYPDGRREEQLRSIVLFLVSYEPHRNKRHYQQEDYAYRPEVGKHDQVVQIELACLKLVARIELELEEPLEVQEEEPRRNHLKHDQDDVRERRGEIRPQFPFHDRIKRLHLIAFGGNCPHKDLFERADKRPQLEQAEVVFDDQPYEILPYLRLPKA
jgi:hypothetical protein